MSQVPSPRGTPSPPSEALCWHKQATTASRLDAFLRAQFPDVSKRQWRELFQDGAIYIDGVRQKKGGVFIVSGQTVGLLRIPQTRSEQTPVPQPGYLSVVYIDPHIVAIDKPANTPTHILSSRDRDTLSNRLAYHYPECIRASPDPRECGFVHRLDTHTTGIIIAARNHPAWENLRKQFADNTVQKSYLAIVPKSFDAHGKSEISLSMKGNRAVADPMGYPACTSWSTVSVQNDWRVVRCTTTTGRTHQVRAHLALSGGPIRGDNLYGSTDTRARHFYLHAETIRFHHPKNNIPRTLHSLPPTTYSLPNTF